MAKPKSEDKRNSILSAATQVFAERGLGAPTAAITTAAGIAEGSLFTYFKTKDELINALYRELKLELADSMMSSFPRKQSVRRRLEHVWRGYLQWGVDNPDQQKVLKQVQVWGISLKILCVTASSVILCISMNGADPACFDSCVSPPQN